MAKSPEKPKAAKTRARGDVRGARDANAPTAKKRPSGNAASGQKGRARVAAAPAAPAGRVPKSTKRSAIPPRPAANTPNANAPRKPKRAVAPRARAAAAPGPAQPDRSGVGAPGRAAGAVDARLENAVALGGRSPAPFDASPGQRPELEGGGHQMELHWGDDVPSSRRAGGLVQRWVRRGDALLRHLAEHGAARHEYRADLRDGRFVWVDPEGRVSAEAQAQVLCSWSRSTSSLSMAWADPLVRAVGIARIEGVPAEQDDCDEETAWRVAMQAADRARAEYLYRVNSPHAWYFLALSSLTFHPERESFTPSTPVGLVRRGLAETLRAVESRAEPAEIVRQRLTSLGESLLYEAEYAYRGTDWVARLERTGRRLVSLGEQLPRPSYGSVAAGRLAGEWLDRQATLDVSDVLALLEDEWALFT